MSKKRYSLKSWHFHKNTGVLYDNLTDETLELSLYDIINLLNKATEAEYTLKSLRNDIIKKIDEVTNNEKRQND